MQYFIDEDVKVPALGFGTYQLQGKATATLVAYALESGYRHIDTAQIYANEEFVGEGIGLSGVPRQDIFLTTKIWIDNFESKRLIPSVINSLEKLKTNYVDLLLLHWPSTTVPLAETIAALNEAYEKNYARYIGISNFNIAQMKEANKLSKSAIRFNQIEYHPYLTQDKLVRNANELGIRIMSHSSMAQGEIIKEPTINFIAQKYNKDATQIILRWLYQLGIASLSRSSQKNRIQSNADIFDFYLEEADMEQIKTLGVNSRRFINPAGLAPAWD